MRTNIKLFNNVLDRGVMYGGYIVMIFLAFTFAMLKPIFLSFDNIMNILMQSSVLGVVSCGMTLILIGGGTHVIKGGIDLSLGGNLALGCTITALLLRNGMPFVTAFLISFALSLIIGFINAVTVVILKVPPLLGTLAMMYLLNGLVITISNNMVVSSPNAVLDVIANYKLASVPLITIIFMFVFISLYILINKTSFGNRTYAVGGNSEAAKYAGLNVNTLVMSTYILAAATASISGLLSNARLTGSAPGIGDSIFLDIMLISYMSAVFSKKAVPNITGALISALFVGMLSNGFTLLGVSSYWVYAIKGILILVSVSSTSFRTRRAR